MPSPHPAVDPWLSWRWTCGSTHLSPPVWGPVLSDREGQRQVEMDWEVSPRSSNWLGSRTSCGYGVSPVIRRAHTAPSPVFPKTLKHLPRPLRTSPASSRPPRCTPLSPPSTRALTTPNSCAHPAGTPSFSPDPACSRTPSRAGASSLTRRRAARAPRGDWQRSSGAKLAAPRPKPRRRRRRLVPRSGRRESRTVWLEVGVEQPLESARNCRGVLLLRGA